MKWLLCSALVLASTPAFATPYETFVDVADQGDLEDLLAAGDITPDTFDELLELLGNGVELDSADRAQLYALPNLTYEDVDAIIAFREKNKGRITDPAILVSAGALSEDKLLAISAFLVLEGARDTRGLRGWVRLATRVSNGDDLAPPWALRGRFTALRHLSAGFAAVFTRLEPGAPAYDPAREALIADPQGYRVKLPKLYVRYDDDALTAIAGSYRIGFGQRLVFDNTSRYTPNGIHSDDDLIADQDLTTTCKESRGERSELDPPCSEADEAGYVTPDWRWRDGLLGVAAGLKHLELGLGWLQGYAWASANNRRVYQYELVDRALCADPSADDAAGCSAPGVFVRPDGNPLAPASKFKFITLPDVFQERLAGANVAYFADRRSSIGLTAYGALEENLVGGIDLDTQEWSSLPTGRRFGAAGANASFGRGAFDLFGELAFSYDRLPDAINSPATGGGGAAGILRATWTRKREELELVLRSYGIDFANPFARPISQPDTLDGQRARDERGIRLRYYRGDRRLTVRALVDVWESPSQRDATQLGRSQPKLETYVRSDVRISDDLRLGLWLRYQDKDLRAGGRAQCFEVSTEFDENGEPIPCGGRQLTTIGRARYQLARSFSLTAMLEHQLLDDPTIVDDCDLDNPGPCKRRQDGSAWLIGLWQPNPDIRVRGRVRYLDEDLGAIDSLETSLSAVVDAAFKLRGRDVVRVRGDYRSFLDERAATIGSATRDPRNPNPELQLWLSYEARL